MIRQN